MGKSKNPVRYNNPCCGGCGENKPANCGNTNADCLIFCNIHNIGKIDPCGGTFSVNIFQEGTQHLLADCAQGDVELTVHGYTEDFINVLISGGVVTGLTSDIITSNPTIQILATCGDKQNIFDIYIDIKNLCKNVNCDPSCEECNQCTGVCEEVQIDLVGEEIEINKENC